MAASIDTSAAAIRALLVKYMAHILESEGISYTNDGFRCRHSDSVTFTDEEWALLQAIAQEARASN